MSADPRELVPEIFRAFNEGGADGFLDYLVERDALHPEFLMELQHDAPNGGVWRGPDGIREMSRTWLEVWEVFEMFPEDPIEVGPDRYVVPVRQRVVARGSGLEMDERFFYTVEFSDGCLWRMGLFTDRSGADRYLAGGGA